MNYKLFEVRDFDKTLEKHRKRIDTLAELMSEQGIEYSDILDNDAWQVVDTETWKSVELIASIGVKQSERQIARIINANTRQVIVNSLGYYNLPKSYDTAFFMAHYMKIIEGMSDILENINARKEQGL